MWVEQWPLLCNRTRTSLLYLSLRNHWLQAPQAVQFIHSELHHFQYLPYWISPWYALSWWGAHLLSSLLSLHRRSKTVLPAVHLTIITTRGPTLTPKRSKLGVNTALHRVMRTCPNWYQELVPALNNEGRNLSVFLSSPTRAMVNLEYGTAARSSKCTRDQASSDSQSSMENVDDCDMDTTYGDCISCSDRWGVCMNFPQKVLEEDIEFL